MTREEVLEMIVEVMESPTECRIIVDTKIPMLVNAFSGDKKALPPDTIYYMIDRAEMSMEEDNFDMEPLDHWNISCELDTYVEVKDTMKVVDFIMTLCERVNNPRVWVESY